ALSAIGSFDPDPPGALAADRDPPGFEVLTGKVTSSLPAPRRREAEKKAASAGAARAARQHAAALERAQRTAERLRHAATAQAAVVDELRAKLRAAEADLKEASNRATAAEKELAKLEPPE
ncbi:MAG TPA: hypothetical protein VL172_04310, partial [Kofleriaceae bacterium]|nr:hypothetical protein [Kofleriaceae bacterium]